MRSSDSKEYEIRTPRISLLACTFEVRKNQPVELIVRHGKREDTILLDDFLDQIHAHSALNENGAI